MRMTAAMMLPGLGAVACLLGCASGSGIVPVGPDTYAVSEMRAPALGGGPEAQRVVLAEANAFCAQQGRTPETVRLSPAGDPFTPYYPTAFEHVFRCGALAR